jgi:hypothetical protein
MQREVSVAKIPNIRGPDHMSSLIKDVQRQFIDAELDRMLTRNKKNYPNDIHAAQKQTLRDVGQIMFSNCPRALANIDRFLDGTGKDWEFDLLDLLSEDKNASERIHGELIRRVLKINTRAERSIKARATPVHEDAIDPEITLFQSTYSSKDWWGALGTFNIRFTPIASLSDGRIFVRLTGQNTYKWYKDESRVTQSLHRMAVELEAAKQARNFEMKVKPRTYVVSTALKSFLVFERQVDPKAGVLERLTSRMDARTALQFAQDKLSDISWRDLRP